ncbi:hypothetical protein N9158_01510 [bacterium]|nr:hypothetical protein [Akkermansiaceae bacterium]MDB4455959.1 hypothetical protein [bacterium]MDB4545811.1 hypothetical protein [Akkermansiaceae bacterium]
MNKFPPFALALLGAMPSFGAGTLSIRAPGYDWQNGEYSTNHVYVDEIAGTTAAIEVRFAPGVGNVTDVEVFTNLNRRDLATADKNADGEHDAILPVDGNTITDSSADTDPVSGHYYIPINLSDSDSDGTWTATIPATKTGAYRMTARFKTSGDPNWQWYGLRDHAIVVTPTVAQDIRMYELNVFNIEASASTEAGRSTWEDLADLPGALHTGAGRVNNWNLQNYAADLGINWLWFQPYHPYGEEGRHLSADNINARDPSQSASTLVRTGGVNFENSGYPYDLGSPYAVKNFFEIDPRTSASYNSTDSVAVGREKARQSFVDFVAAADSAGVNLMPDAAFNHAAWDFEVGPSGIGSLKNGHQFWGNTWMDAQGASGWAETDIVHDRELRVFSRNGDYRLRASFYNSFFDNNIAPGPDRTDFGKWLDVVDIFYGRYAALVGAQDGSETLNRNNEGDWFDTTSYAFNGTDGGSFDAFARATWRSFAQYVPYWMSQSRSAGENRNSTSADGNIAAREAFDLRGIDGLRCDFGQGIPPQAWEYIINVARSHKWSFVFMAESLDGGAVTYRSSRHFDVLNENIIFAVKGINKSRSALKQAYEDRRAAYGQAQILLTTVSHDEDSYADPFVACANYLAHASMDGAPMIFPGQELGISTTFGYDLYEKNFGKFVPHFKTWNSMMPVWKDTDFANDQLFEVYAGANRARIESPALRSPNRWFLDGNGPNDAIHAVAKYESAGASPARSDVMLAFANLDRDSVQGDTYKIPTTLANLLGLANGRTYNTKNRAAFTGQVAGRDGIWLWDGGFSRADLINTGVPVSLAKVPISAAAWMAPTNEPFEAQYLKVYDVTPPPSPAPLANYYQLGTTMTFTWDPASAGGSPVHDVIASYLVTVRDDSGTIVSSATVSDGSNSYSFTGVAGETYRAEITAVSAAGISSTSPASSNSGAPNGSIPTTASILLDPNADEDGDGDSNGIEVANGRDPLVPDALFRIISIGEEAGGIRIVFTSIPGSAYAIETSTDLGGVSQSWTEVVDDVPASSFVTSFLFTGPLTEGSKRFYRVGRLE